MLDASVCPGMLCVVIYNMACHSAVKLPVMDMSFLKVRGTRPFLNCDR